MKTLLPFLLLWLLASSANADAPEDKLPPVPNGKTWKLVWNDEFDGDKLDESKWDVPDNRRRVLHRSAGRKSLRVAYAHGLRGIAPGLGNRLRGF